MVIQSEHTGIGLDNLAAVAGNTGKTPVIINGKGLKSINKYYNKQISHYCEIAKRMNGRDYTNRMAELTEKKRKIDDYLQYKRNKLFGWRRTGKRKL